MKLFQFTCTEMHTMEKSHSSVNVNAFVFLFYDSHSSNFNYSRFHTIRCVYVKHAVEGTANNCFIRRFFYSETKEFCGMAVAHITHSPANPQNASIPFCKLRVGPNALTP